MLLKDLDALLITDPLNIRYLTDFAGLAPEEREGYVVVTAHILYLCTNALYTEQAHALEHSTSKIDNSMKIICKEISREQPLAGKIKEILDSLPLNHTPTLGFEEQNLTVAEFKKLKVELPGIELVPTKDTIEDLRRIKRPEEIASIRTAAKITDKCFTHILPRLKKGITEGEIAWEIETFIRKQGAESAFPPIVAFNQNSSQPHYTPKKGSTLLEDSLVLLDFGAKVKGYCADMTRVVFVGKPTTKQTVAYQAVFNAHQAVLTYISNAVRSTFARGPLTNGFRKAFAVSGAAADTISRNSITKEGFPPYPHSLGHSVGLAIHEGPRLSIKHDEELKPGMVVTVEPGIYIPGEFGIRIEDLVHITSERIEVLSNSPKNLTII